MILQHTKKHVVVDRFTCIDNDPENTTYIMTHVHLDHNRVPQSWIRPILCSPQTKHLMARSDRRLVGKLEAPKRKLGRWYTHTTSKGDKLHLFVFRTNHCYGSIGVFVKETGLLHIGDNNLSVSDLDSLIQTIGGVKVVNKVVIDWHLWKYKRTIPRTVPSQAQSMKMIDKCIQHALASKRRPRVLIKHLGILLFLPTNARYSYTWGRRPRTQREQYLEHASTLILNSIQSKNKKASANNDLVTLAFEPTPSRVHIIPSTNYWMMHPQLDLFTTAIDENQNVRVFANTHMTPESIKHIKTMFPKKAFD